METPSLATPITELEVLVQLHNKLMHEVVHGELDLEYFTARLASLGGSQEDKAEKMECEQNIKKLKRVNIQNKLYLSKILAKIDENVEKADQKL